MASQRLPVCVITANLTPMHLVVDWYPTQQQRILTTVVCLALGSLQIHSPVVSGADTLPTEARLGDFCGQALVERLTSYVQT